MENRSPSRTRHEATVSSLGRRVMVVWAGSVCGPSIGWVDELLLDAPSGFYTVTP